jgi:hypothetical protein
MNDFSELFKDLIETDLKQNGIFVKSIAVDESPFSYHESNYKDDITKICRGLNGLYVIVNNRKWNKEKRDVLIDYIIEKYDDSIIKVPFCYRKYIKSFDDFRNLC